MKATNVWFDNNNMYFQLDSGHTKGNSISWFTRLANATPEQRLKFEIDPWGESLRWEELDEDLSVESLFDFKHELNYAKI
jgi:hypothetical protein